MGSVCKIDGCGGQVNARGLCVSHYKRLCRHGDPLGGRTKLGLPLEYMEREFERDTDECLIWPYANDGKGYGIVWFNKKNCYVHRIICERVNGPPTKLKPISRHLCGNGHLGCFNKKHLIWSDQKENMADKLIHGTSNRGERQGISKLKNEEVMEIYRSGDTTENLAKRFNVTRSNIRCIKNGVSWSWLTGHKKKGGD